MGDRSFIEVAGGEIEFELSRSSGADGGRAPLVFLHEGLGSIDLWRGVPDAVAALVDDRPVLVYARHGHGASAPAGSPRPATYMHREADVVLPALLDQLGLRRPVLVGHSDGASIALLHAGGGHAVTGLVCLAPHVFVEAESIAGIEAARDAFEASPDMAAKMGRYHADPVATFRGWNDVWLSEEFRAWDITDRLAAIDAPILLVQGTDDQYGTFAQLDAIESGVRGPVTQLRLDGAGHAPHLDARDDVVTAIARFVDALDGGVTRRTW